MMDSTYTAKWQDFIPRPGKIKNNTNFCLTIQLHICFFNQWVTSTHLLWDCWHILHDLIEIMEFSQILIIPAFYSIALENSCIAKVQSGQISVKTGNIFYLSMLNQICCLYVERKSGVFLRSLTTYQILEELINLRLKCSF